METCTLDLLQRFPGVRREGRGRFILIFSNIAMMFRITCRFAVVNELEFLTLKSVYTDNSLLSVRTKHNYSPDRNGKYIDGEATS